MRDRAAQGEVQTTTCEQGSSGASNGIETGKRTVKAICLICQTDDRTVKRNPCPSCKMKMGAAVGRYHPDCLSRMTEVTGRCPRCNLPVSSVTVPPKTVSQPAISSFLAKRKEKKNEGRRLCLCCGARVPFFKLVGWLLFLLFFIPPLGVVMFAVFIPCEMLRLIASRRMLFCILLVLASVSLLLFLFFNQYTYRI